MKPSRIVLALALLALAALFALWFRADGHYLAALLVFVLPPLLVLIGVLLGSARAAFWAGVLALFWFSHGVMVAYSRPSEAGRAWLEIVLALVVVLASSWPGLRAKFGRRPR